MSLERFIEAQEGVFDEALRELTAARKRTHWMWFIFPQLAGLGRSATAQFYGIRDLDEARDYLAHPLLSARLTACAEAILQHKNKSAEAILGPIDALKLRSSATLFEAASGGTVFSDLLTAFYGGTRCAATQQLIGKRSVNGQK